MIHFSCDACGKHLDPDEDQRFVVKIEIVQAFDPMDGEADVDDRDYLQEIHEALQTLDAHGLESASDDLCQELRFDLCAECRKKFSKNPLGRPASKQFDFSKN